MFSRFGKKKTTRKENPPPINPTLEGILNHASRIHQARPTSVMGVDPANPQGQRPGNSIIAGSSSPTDPAEVSSTPSTSMTSVIGVDPANPQGQTPGNSIIAGPSAPADPAQVSSSPSTSSTSVIENIVIFGLLFVAAFVGFVSGIIYAFWKAIPGNSRTSVIGVHPANSQGQTPGNSIVAGPSAPADPAQVSTSPSTSSSISVTVFATFLILGVLFVRDPKIIFKAMVIIFETKIIVAGVVVAVSKIIQTFWKASPGDSRTSVTVFAIFVILGVLFVREPKIIFRAMVIIFEAMIIAVGVVQAVCKVFQTFWKASPGDSKTSVIGVDPVNPQGQTPGNSIIAGPSAPADPAQVSSSY